MKGTNTWSYRPYKPLLYNVGDVYICRVVPYEDAIHFEWLDDDGAKYDVYYRVRGEGEFIHYATLSGSECDIKGLTKDTEYEFYVACGEKKSLVRLARCGESVGTVVNYLHPEDPAYSFSGKYLCSPSLVRHPDGFLLASMDLFAGNYPQNLTLIFRSDDDGVTWHYVSELMPCFWGKLFIHKGELYMLSCSTEYGDLLIGKSTDGGKTFGTPTVLLRGGNGKNNVEGVHKNPQNIVRYNGRIYETLEWGSWGNQQYWHAAMVMSCDENDDLLVPENWSFSEPKPFNPGDAPELANVPHKTMTIEGTLVVTPENKLMNVMRFGFPMQGYALCYDVDTDNPEGILKYSYLMPFEAHLSKFMIKYDDVSKKYFTVANYIFDRERERARTLLSLMASDDLKSWDVVSNLIDRRECDHQQLGFQYVDFEIDGDDIIFLCRTGINNPANYHDTNYSTFHRIKNFREML